MILSILQRLLVNLMISINTKLLKKNKTNIVVDSWKEAENIWWNNRAFLSHIEVLDRKKSS